MTSQPTDSISIAAVASLATAIRENVASVLVGHDDAIDHVITALLARGHVLLDDVPGVGKTMLAKSVAHSIDCSFRRVQFTPDLLPADITGVNVFNQQTRTFDFQPGPIFTNVLLGDEINRAPPKTQSALLEAMAENQVTVDGESRSLPVPFVVIATQNAIEPNRTYELPFAEVDRFMKKLHLGYPTPEQEATILERTVSNHPIEAISPVTDLEEVVRARNTVATVEVTDPVRTYAAELVAYTREHAHIGVSPRGTISLLRAAQARAATDARAYVIPDDVQAEAPTVLAHRLKLPATDGDTTGQTLIDDAIASVPVPVTTP